MSMRALWNDRRLRTVCIVSFALTIIGSGIIVWGAKTTGLDPIVMTGDSKAYVYLAQNLLEHGVFSVYREPPFEPDSFRAPGAPVLLAGIFALFGVTIVAVLVHALVAALVPVLLYILARPLHERAAFWSAILFAFDPVRLFAAASLLSDSFFVMLLFVALITIEKARETRALKWILITGVTLGFSVLVRSIAIFLPILFALYSVISIRPVRRGLSFAALCVVAAYLIVLPWSYRNHILFDSWNVSAVGTANLVVYNAPEYLKWFPDERGSAVLAEFQAKQESLPYHEALTLARSAEYTDTFRDIVRGHEVSYVFFHVVKTIPFFITDGLRDTLRLFIDMGSMPNLSTAIMSGDVSLIMKYLRAGGIAIVLLLLGTAFWGIISLFCFAEGVRAFVKREWFPILFYISIIGYFALLTGPVANARYRLPVAGIMMFLALRFLYRWYDARHERV